MDEDSCQTQKQFAEALNCAQSIISDCLKALGKVYNKEGKWVPYELKPRDIERRKTICDPGQPSTSTSKRNIHGKKAMFCIWWNQKDVVYHELLKSGQTVTGDLYREQIIRLSRALQGKRPEYETRQHKVILLHDNARPHVTKLVKETLEALRWEVLPHAAYSPDCAPSDYHLFRSMAHALAEEHFNSYEGVEKWVSEWIASKDESFFRRGIRLLPEREKSSLMMDNILIEVHFHFVF